MKSFADSVDYALKKVSNIRVLTVFRASLFIMLLIVLIFMFNVVTNKATVETLVEQIAKQNKEEREDMNIRDMVSPKIQRNLHNLVYKLDCDRAFIIELHNGNKNATELPFKFYDMTYEEVNDDRNAKHISQNYLNVLVTHYKLPYYLAKETYFGGTTEELAQIDSRFGENMSADNGKYLGIIILRNSKEEIGFLGVAFDKRVPENKELVKKELHAQAKVMKELLDLNFQRQNYLNDERNSSQD